MADSKNSEPEGPNDHTETGGESYENPNYRKLYAKLNMNAMIGVDKIQQQEEEEEKKQEQKQKMIEMARFYEEDDSFDEDEDEDEDEYEDLSSGQDGDEEVNLKQCLLQQQQQPGGGKNENYELPEGWERHEDELGPYFWHIPTGTIQRERPFLDTIDKSMIRSDSLVFLDKSAINVDYNPGDSCIDENPDAESKAVEENDDDDDDDGEEAKPETKALIQHRKKVVANMRLTFPTDDEEEEEEDEDEDGQNLKEMTFVVHSLGWLDVEESQINSHTGSMVIKRCIYELSTRAENAARCWGPGETQSLALKINAERISLVEPNTGTVLSVQLIREIRMWAVDDANNFAYVVKDRNGDGGKNLKPGTVKCHVFHCDDQQPVTSENSTQNAQRLAIYLKDALVRIKNGGGRHQNRGRPRNLPVALKPQMENFEFPTPIEEPKKCIPALYIGFVPVTKPMGVDILNMAIDEVVQSLKMSLDPHEHANETDLMRQVVVNVSPSNILVECNDTGATLVECRVRYLSFMGISLDNVKRCGFIMQINDREFVCHCFEVEPSAGALCKTIEAACKLRYQKCLDAHAKQIPGQQETSSTPTTPINDSLKSSPVAALKSSISGVFYKILNKSGRG